MSETTSERISPDEAIRRGYVWMRCGWNHEENAPIIAPIGMMKVFCVSGISVADLDVIKALVNTQPEPNELPEPGACANCANPPHFGPCRRTRAINASGGSGEQELESYVRKMWDGLFPPADWCGAESAVSVMAQQLRAYRRKGVMRETARRCVKIAEGHKSFLNEGIDGKLIAAAIRREFGLITSKLPGESTVAKSATVHPTDNASGGTGEAQPTLTLRRLLPGTKSETLLPQPLRC